MRFPGASLGIQKSKLQHWRASPSLFGLRAAPLLEFFMLFLPRLRNAEQAMCCRLATDEPIINLPQSPLSAGEHGQLRRAKHAFIGGHAATFAASSECFIEPAPSLTFRANQLMHDGISRSAASHHFGRRQTGFSPQKPALRLCTASYQVKKKSGNPAGKLVHNN
ncbi:hypothetical protein [Casimicrobium huifangae]|uniref:hypothetical protein n=1 Tax=Casimicrobium huifangae TaxID=2591109 RepID=UPI00378464EB